MHIYVYCMYMRGYPLFQQNWLEVVTLRLHSHVHGYMKWSLYKLFFK